jgi:hypothetical protein
MEEIKPTHFIAVEENLKEMKSAATVVDVNTRC